MSNMYLLVKMRGVNILVCQPISGVSIPTRDGLTYLRVHGTDLYKRAIPCRYRIDITCVCRQKSNRMQDALIRGRTVSAWPMYTVSTVLGSVQNDQRCRLEILLALGTILCFVRRTTGPFHVPAGRAMQSVHGRRVLPLNEPFRLFVRFHTSFAVPQSVHESPP
jgi:hypothetical protein